MAKNYTFAEAVEIINKGTDLEAIAELGKRFPILVHKVTKVTTKAGEDFVELMGYLPEHLTANKVNTAMKNATSTESEVEEETEVEEEAPKKATKKAAAKDEEVKETSEGGYDSMSGKELWDLLGKAGKRKDCKEKMGGTKKDDMIAYINKYGLGDEAEAETEEAQTEEETEESTNPYEGISAMDLFKECKKRGIKAAPKKPAKFYIDLLLKDDETKAEESESETEEDDDWGEEIEEPKEEKKPAKAKKAAPKKAAKEEAEDDDDWDI